MTLLTSPIVFFTIFKKTVRVINFAFSPFIQGLMIQVLIQILLKVIANFCFGIGQEIRQPPISKVAKIDITHNK